MTLTKDPHRTSGKPSVRGTQRRKLFNEPHRIILWTVTVVTTSFLLLPTVLVYVTSVGPDRFVRFPPRGLTFRWYGDVDVRFIDAAVMSIGLGVTVAVAALLLGVSAGLALARGRFRSSKLVDAFIRSPLQVPGVVIGVALLQYYGLVATHTGVPLFGTFTGLFLAHVVIVTPYVVSATVAGFANSDLSVEEAAYSLGASQKRTLFQITLPRIKSSLWSGTFFAFLVSFDEVPATLFLSVTNQTTLPVEMFFEAEFRPTPTLYAVSAMVTAFTTAVVLIFHHFVGLRQTVTSR